MNNKIIELTRKIALFDKENSEGGGIKRNQQIIKNSKHKK
jgi:hypothetical protein